MRARRAERDPDAFRCPGCETPTKDGRWCLECRMDEADYHAECYARDARGEVPEDHRDEGGEA